MVNQEATKTSEISETTKIFQKVSESLLKYHKF